MHFSILFHVLTLWFVLLPIEAQDVGTCSDEFTFTSQDAEVGEPDKIDSSFTFLPVAVSETIPEGNILYIISWLDDLETDPYVDTEKDDDRALDFVNRVISEKNLSIEVNSSMFGLVDYNNDERRTELMLNLYFEFPSLNESICTLQISHILIDENTQEPHLDDENYEISIREDFPVNMVIPEFQPAAYDYDVTEPNNVFSISMDPECPLKPSSSQYRGAGDDPVYIQFILSTVLDYDKMEAPYQHSCNVTLIDEGAPSRNSTSTVTVTVAPYSDEEPAFADETKYFKGIAAESVINTVVTTEPTIEAYDVDMPPSAIVYKMASADSTVNGDEYFAMNETTGVITITQDIDNDFLLFGSVDFIITVCDADEQCSEAFLSIELPTVSSNSSFIQFERLTYSTQIFTPEQGEQILRVHAQTLENEEVIYSFVQDGSAGLDYFAVDETSGWISATTNSTPTDIYGLNARAAVGGMADQTKVNIDVTLPTNPIIMMKESIVMVQVEENNTTLLLTVEAEGANFYCLVACWPDSWFSSFQLKNDTGELSIVSGLDADDSNLGNEVVLKIAAYSKPTDCPRSNISNQLRSYEEQIGIAIIDVDEFAPSFVDAGGEKTESILYAFPEEKDLQKSIGPVATVMVIDGDVTSTASGVVFSLDGASNFIIDEDSGELYLVGELACQDICTFTVTAHDSVHQSELAVNVTTLDLDHIFTIIFENSDVNEIGNSLSTISATAGISIYLLYANVISESTEQQRDSSKWTIEAQVYAVQGMDLLDMDELNKILGDAGLTTSATQFTDSEYYAVPIQEKDFKTATIVLGCVLGFVVLVSIAAAGFALWRRKKNGGSNNSKISTLGNAYSNQGFKGEKEEPSFSTIFGNNPVEITPTYDTIEATKNTNKNADSGNFSTFREDRHAEAAPDQSPKPSTSKYYISSTYTPIKDDISKDKVVQSSQKPYEIYNFEAKLNERTSDKRTHTEEVVDVHVSSIYPSEEVRSEYEKEVLSASSLSEAKQSPLIGHKFDSAEKKDDTSDASEIRSNIKLYPEVDYGDEDRKSVAFKVLVDTKIIQDVNDDSVDSKKGVITTEDAVVVEESDSKSEFSHIN